MNDEGTLSVDEFVEYCRTQAGLLSGRVETIGGEIDALLDEIDEDIAAIRTDLAAESKEATEATVSPSVEPNDAESGGAAAGEREGEVETDLENRERQLEEKQTIAEAKQARMAAFQDLAAAYLELAEELESTVDDGREALDRVVRFERDHDAPAYFDERKTVLEAAADSNESSEE